MTFKITAEFLYNSMQEIVALGHRVSGSPEERAAAGYISAALKDAGLSDVTYEPFRIRCYSAQPPSLVAATGDCQHAIPAAAIWYTQSGSITAPAVNMGFGAPRDFRQKDIKGKVAVVESKILLNYEPTHTLLETYHQAVTGGAVAFVAWIDAPYDLLPRYNHLKEDELPGPIPGLLLARGDGVFLNHLLQTSDAETELRIELASKEWKAETGDVVGYLKGSEEVIIVGSHYDSVYSGAVDNAAANAGLIALAHFAAAMQGQHPTIVFCAHPGHEVNVGAREFVARHEDLLKRAGAYLSIDGFGSGGYSWNASGVMPTGSDEKRGISVSDNPLLLQKAIAAVKKYNLLPAAYVPASDIIFNKDLEGRFYERGLPTLMIIGKPIWYHTRADTADKISADQLYRSYLAHAEILNAIAEAGAGQIRKNDRQPAEDVIASVMPQKITEAGWDKGRSLSFSFIPQPAVTGEPCLFFISDFANPEEVLVDLRWDFGDGHTARGPVTFNVYEKPGRYDVKISMVDTGGFRSMFKRVLWVE